MMEQLPVIRMKKDKKECWCMDRENYTCFISYLRHYFVEDESFPLITPDNILHAYVSNYDMCLVFSLFEVVYMDREKMAIEGVFPKRYIVTRENTLTIRLCVEIENEKRFFLLHLKMNL
jgi:hypothetical protein